MNDFEPLVETDSSVDESETPSRVYNNNKNEGKDDIAGMIINASKKIDVRQMFIIWLLFIFLHTEFFMEKVISKIKGAVNKEGGDYTIMGTFYASFIMIVGILILNFIFN